jgi:hypothetical protein
VGCEKKKGVQTAHRAFVLNIREYGAKSNCEEGFNGKEESLCWLVGFKDSVYSCKQFFLQDLGSGLTLLTAQHQVVKSQGPNSP